MRVATVGWAGLGLAPCISTRRYDIGRDTKYSGSSKKREEARGKQVSGKWKISGMTLTWRRLEVLEQWVGECEVHTRRDLQVEGTCNELAMSWCNKLQKSLWHVREIARSDIRAQSQENCSNGLRSNLGAQAASQGTDSIR